MKKFPVVIVVLLVILSFSGGCYYDNEETLYPPQGCDTADVKYSTHIVEILDNKCLQCHNNVDFAVEGGGFSWEGYANISSYLSTSSNVLISAINHEVGFTPMPYNNPKLSECEIRTIEIWIEDGFPNN